MATTIDIENAKQIRQPMDVIVTMTETSSNSANLSNYSSYSYKVANYDSAETTDNAMRLIADLQGDGFPLDDSHYLYESNATDANGKVGIRGNIGGTLGVRVSASSRMSRLSVAVTGCASMSYNGTTYDASTGYVLVPLSAYSANLIFYPADAEHRIEIAYIVPSVNFEITNENLISCTLELRADLKPIDPTLPQSEIVVEIYSPNDVAEVMADVINELPITYSAGYAGDMSPTRQFYLSEQATWEDNVLTIHGVDASSRLEKEIDPFYIGRFFYDVYTRYRQIFSPTVQGGHWMLYQAFVDTLKNCGIEPEEEDVAPPKTSADSLLNGNLVRSVVDVQPGRDLIANMMNLLHQDYNAGDFTGIDSYWLTYVDAGRPTVRWRKPSARWTIKEEDCGDIHRDIERKIGKLAVPNKKVNISAVRNDTNNPHRLEQIGQGQTEVGQADIIKDSGVALKLNVLSDMDLLTYVFNPIVHYNNLRFRQHATLMAPQGFPLTQQGWRDTGSQHVLPEGATYDQSYGKKLFGGELWQDWSTILSDFWRFITGTDPRTPLYQEGTTPPLRVYPVDPTEDSAQLQIFGAAYNLDDNTTVYRFGDGVEVEASNTSWAGFVWVRKKDRSKAYQILPEEGVKSLGKRSRETGSFTWKGDPRMQPRDVFNFEKLDGTNEARTVESISLKHERGGTSATVTYRKGVV